jgi:hypothetical protein
VVEGDTARVEVWAKLDAVLARDWPHGSGHTLPIRVMCVDAGYATQDVYAWRKRWRERSSGMMGRMHRRGPPSGRSPGKHLNCVTGARTFKVAWPAVRLAWRVRMVLN